MKNYYVILGVNRNADQDSIKKIYHQLSQIYHPDKNLSGVNQQRMLDVNEAYEVLSNPSKRKEFDAALFLKETPTVTPPPPRREASQKKPTPKTMTHKTNTASATTSSTHTQTRNTRKQDDLSDTLLGFKAIAVVVGVVLISIVSITNSLKFSVITTFFITGAIMFIFRRLWRKK